MQKMIMDMSKPEGERITVRDMTPEEISKQEARWAAKAAPQPKSIEERLAELETKGA